MPLSAQVSGARDCPETQGTPVGPGIARLGGWPGVMLMLVLVLLTIGVRLALAPAHEPLQHDEGISMMHAAGKSVVYDEMVHVEAPPIGTWTSAQVWNAYLIPDGLDLSAVITSTTKSDLHPPLYFMLVDAWQSLFGTSRNAGWHLNIVFSIGTALVIYMLGLRLTDSPITAAVSAAAWAVLPGAVETSLTIRQYDMLALFTALIAWRAVVIAESEEPPRVKEYVALGLVCTLGLMSHIYFVLPMSGAFVWIAIKSFAHDRRRVGLVLGSMVLGFALAVALNVDSFTIFGRTGRSGWDRTVHGMLLRAKAFFLTLLSGTGITRTSLKGIFSAWASIGVRAEAVRVATAILGGVAAAVAVYLTRPSFGRLRQSITRGGAALFMLGWLTLAVGAMYVSIPSLSPALGARYLAMTWPFVGLCIGVLGSALCRGRWLPVSLAAAWFVFAAFTANTIIPRFDPAVLRAASHVVLDNPARGVLLPYADAASADTEFYAAWRDDLLAHPAPWLDRLQPGDLVVLAGIYQPSSTTEDEVLGLVEQRWVLEKVTLRGLRGSVFRVREAVEES
ncbi:MAG: hypothetical protein D9V44_05985 [Actinobacteria bacterium]|nr:MAG: hypothetical protein D9V44_05985 [Actinomycetota bacterium]